MREQIYKNSSHEKSAVSTRQEKFITFLFIKLSKKKSYSELLQLNCEREKNLQAAVEITHLINEKHSYIHVVTKT